MIKVAVCLRGQPRFAQAGARLFEKMVQDRHPDVEFKFFAHSWNTLSKRMVSEDKDIKQQDRSLPQLLTYEETHELVSHWNPERVMIESEQDNLYLARDIDRYNSKREADTYEWFKKYTEARGWDQSDLRFANRNLLIPVSIEMADVFSMPEMLHSDTLSIELDALVKYKTVNFSYLLGQMHSAGKSFNLLQQYIEETDYVPDIVINTRYDVMTWFYHFPKLLLEVKESRQVSFPVIFSKNVSTVNSKPVVDDYTFVGHLFSFIPFLSDIRKRLYTSFTRGAFNMMDLFDSASHIQHQMWTKIADPDLHFAQPPTVHWESIIIRPGHDPVDKIKEFDKNTFNRLAKQSVDYEYPENTKSLTHQQMLNLYRTLDQKIKHGTN